MSKSKIRELNYLKAPRRGFFLHPFLNNRTIGKQKKHRQNKMGGVN
jgi:hypothetical protein